MRPRVPRRLILVVEDEPVVRNVIVRILVRAGYDLMEADSAAEAFEMSNTYSGVIDLLIADHVLKGKTGREVAEHLRLSRPGMKILQTSGSARDTVEQQGGLMWGAEFLPKPFSATELLETVNRVLAANDTLSGAGG